MIVRILGNFHNGVPCGEITGCNPILKFETACAGLHLA